MDNGHHGVPKAHPEHAKVSSKMFHLNGFKLRILTLKVPKKKIAADDILIFYFYLLKKIRLDFSCESPA